MSFRLHGERIPLDLVDDPVLSQGYGVVVGCWWQKEGPILARVFVGERAVGERDGPDCVGPRCGYCGDQQPICSIVCRSNRHGAFQLMEPADMVLER